MKRQGHHMHAQTDGAQVTDMCLMCLMQGDPGNEMFIVSHGAVSVWACGKLGLTVVVRGWQHWRYRGRNTLATRPAALCIDPEGNDMEVAQLQKGSYFGEIALMVRAQAHGCVIRAPVRG